MSAKFSDGTWLNEDGIAAPQAESVHAYLRRTTRDLHEKLDAAYGVLDLQSREGLATFLTFHAAALLPLEDEIDASGAAAVLPDWPSRRRSEAILADLRQLGLPVPPLTTAPELPTTFHLWGALYVLEGSKLGAHVLRRRVAKSSDPEVRAATRFLGHADAAGWLHFLSLLNRLPETALSGLEAGATAAFGKFLPPGHSAAEPDGISRLRSTLVRSNQA